METKKQLTVEDLEAMHKAGELAGRIFTADELSNEVYHAGPGISHSGLKEIGRSPLHYMHKKRHGSQATAAMQKGTLIHMALLEPERFAASVIDSGCNDKRLKAYKAVVAENPGCMVMKAAEYEEIDGARKAVEGHPIAVGMLRGGVAESSLYWTDKETGILCRCRPDYMLKDEAVLVDLKKTQSATAEDICRTIANYGYHTQAAFYMAGFEAIFGYDPFFRFVFVEEKAPHGVRVVELMDGEYNPQNPFDGGYPLEFGRMLNKKRLQEYASCLSDDNWPGYPPAIDQMDIPHWAYDPKEVA